MNSIERYKTDYIRRYRAGRVMRDDSVEMVIHPYGKLPQLFVLKYNATRTTLYLADARQGRPTFAKSFGELAYARFDGNGDPHFRHADWQGNIAMVTDKNGDIEQHNGYYPYGEPWREPTGQPYLFGGKERMRDGGLNDYDFVARRLNSAVGIWAQPDPMAPDFAGTNPYVYCAANPIRYIDPTGCIMRTPEGNVYIYWTSNKTPLKMEETEEAVRMYECYAYTSSDNPIPVLKNNSAKSGYNANCHGQTFLNGMAWINSQASVETILNDEYENISESSAKVGDVIIFSGDATEDEKNKYSITGNSIILHSVKIISIEGDLITVQSKMGESEKIEEVDYKAIEEEYSKTRTNVQVLFYSKKVDDKIKNPNENK